VVRSLWSIAEANSWQLETVGSGWEALESVQGGTTPDLLLLDLPRGDADSLHILRWLRRLRPNLPIILVCYPEDTRRKNEAIRLGAQDYLVRPIDDKKFEFAISGQLNSRSQGIDRNVQTDIGARGGGLQNDSQRAYPSGALSGRRCARFPPGLWLIRIFNG